MENDFKYRKKIRKDYFYKFVYGWIERKCIACNGSGYYDNNGSPRCGGCEGTKKERIRGPKSIMNRDKIQGMILGTAIGDSLGMPVETWGRERILKKYPNGIQKLEKPDGHKWFSNESAGSITDDTQLTLAVMEGMINGNGFNLETIAESHVKAMKETTSGWGNTTRDSVRRLANGVSYKESGEAQILEDGNVSGIGNGVPMKIAPVAVLAILGREKDFNKKIIEFSCMTHYTKKSAYAALIHTNVLKNCLATKNYYDIYDNFFEPLDKLLKNILSLKVYSLDHLKDFKEDEDSYFKLIKSLEKAKKMSFEDIALKYKGSCYVYESLGYTYAHWVKNHKTIDVLYDSINYGIDRNDCDSNASMLGAMLGALHGVKIFPNHLISGLNDYERIMNLTNDFCDKFEIQ